MAIIRACTECGQVAEVGDRQCRGCGARKFKSEHVSANEGSGRSSPGMPMQPCDVVGCYSPAMVRQKREDGSMSKLCAHHYGDDQVFTAANRQWLIDRGIIMPEMTTPQRMKAMAAYRKRLAASKAPPSRQWAETLLRRALDEPIPGLCVKLAEAALRIDSPADEA